MPILEPADLPFRKLDAERHFDALAHCPVCHTRGLSLKYHLFVLQVNGDITARQECDSRKALGDPAVRQWVQEYSELLEKQFAGNPEKRGKFWFPADESARYRWKWDQFNPLSALFVMNTEVYSVVHRRGLCCLRVLGAVSARS